MKGRHIGRPFKFEFCCLVARVDGAVAGIHGLIEHISVFIVLGTADHIAGLVVLYTADFVYRKMKSCSPFRQDLFGPDSMVECWETVVEDFKGFPNDRWPLKKSMMLYFHGISVREVKKPTEPI